MVELLKGGRNPVFVCVCVGGGGHNFGSHFKYMCMIGLMVSMVALSPYFYLAGLRMNTHVAMLHF